MNLSCLFPGQETERMGWNLESQWVANLRQGAPGTADHIKRGTCQGIIQIMGAA
jgi:hypothetical protein